MVFILKLRSWANVILISKIHQLNEDSATPAWIRFVLYTLTDSGIQVTCIWATQAILSFPVQVIHVGTTELKWGVTN